MLRWGGDPKEGGPGNWVSNTFWGRLQPYAFSDVGAVNQKTLAKGINQRLDQLFNSLFWTVVNLFSFDRGAMAANRSTKPARPGMKSSESKIPNMIEVPPAPIPGEAVAVISHSGICEGGVVQPTSRP